MLIHAFVLNISLVPSFLTLTAIGHLNMTAAAALCLNETEAALLSPDGHYMPPLMKMKEQRGTLTKYTVNMTLSLHVIA